MKTGTVVKENLRNAAMAAFPDSAFLRAVRAFSGRKAGPADKAV